MEGTPLPESPSDPVLITFYRWEGLDLVDGDRISIGLRRP